VRILVTGGAGFIGSHVVDAGIAAGHEVAVLDNLWPRGGGRRSNLDPKATLFELDIRDPIVADVFMQFRPEVVSHHAAQHSVASSTRDPQHDADVNARGTLNILQSAVKAGVRKVIFASSAATYGTPEYTPIDEPHRQRPESPYGITKMAGEQYLRYFAAAHGLHHTIFRYGNVYGPRQDPNGEAGVIAIFCHRILHGEPIRIDWDGEQQKDYVYVGDVARAGILALAAADDDVFNLGSGAGTSVNALHRAIAEAIGRDVPVEKAPKREGDIRTCVFSIAKAEKALGWYPQTDLRDGIAKTIEYFRALPL